MWEIVRDRWPPLVEAQMWQLFFLLVISFQLFRSIAKYLNRYKVGVALTQEHKCELPPKLPNRWPLGIDRLKQIWNANAEQRLLAFFCTVADEYEPGNTLYQFLLFGPRAFHVLHPSNVEAILSTNFKEFGFGTRSAVLGPLLGNGIFTQEGQAWRHSRELLRKQFVHARYKDLENSIGEHVDNLVALIPDHDVIDLQPLFFSLTMDTSTALLFGESVYSLRATIDQAEKNQKFAMNFQIAQEGLAKRSRIAPFHYLYNPPRFRNACRAVHEFVEDYIAERGIICGNTTQETCHDKTSWFIEQLAAESSSKTVLRDQLLNVLLAGRDTTACCLSWTFHLLLRHERVLQRLRKEIKEFLGDEKRPNRDQLRRISYLSLVIKESLRLYPPVPLNAREALQDTILPAGGGQLGDRPILVRKGEVVVFSQYINSRRKNIYGPDANDFRPERWESNELNGIGWAYFPFNGGPRQCLGEDYALMQVSYTIVRLLQEFPTISLPFGQAKEATGFERQNLTLVLSSADGCMAAFGNNHGELASAE
ncbi:n-alkane-inducible cytochrome P450 [Paramyrothecium foliicola]|nr:n-alkane-inducible cytochrome P450 [Paramyrothecium foliicola]